MIPMKSVFSNLLLQLVFPVIDGDGVVVSVESVNEGLKTQKSRSYVYEVARHVNSWCSYRHELIPCCHVSIFDHFDGAK